MFTGTPWLLCGGQPEAGKSGQETVRQARGVAAPGAVKSGCTVEEELTSSEWPAVGVRKAFAASHARSLCLASPPHSHTQPRTLRHSLFLSRSRALLSSVFRRHLLREACVTSGLSLSSRDTFPLSC